MSVIQRQALVPAVSADFRAFREFPWSNGSVLRGQAIEEDVRAWLNESPKLEQEIDPKIFSGFAQNLAELNLQAQCKHDPNTLAFLLRMFSTTRASFLSSTTFDGSAHQHVAPAVNTLLCHQLLDQLLDSCGFPANSSRVDFLRTSISQRINKRLKGLLDKLADWSTPIRNFKVTSRIASEASLVSTLSAISVTQPSEIFLPPNASHDARIFHSQLLALGRAVAHTDSANAHNVYANLEFTAFASSWYSRPYWGDLEDCSSLRRVMETYGLVPSSANFYNRFGPQLGKEFFQTVKLIYQTAAAVSPIVLFIPKKLGAKTFRRDHLLHVTHALGNLKPSHLRQVENAIWRLILRIASGSSAMEQVRAFLREFDAMVEAWSSDLSNPPVFDFFTFFDGSEVTTSLSVSSSLTSGPQLAQIAQEGARVPCAPVQIAQPQDGVEHSTAIPQDHSHPPHSPNSSPPVSLIPVAPERSTLPAGDPVPPPPEDVDMSGPELAQIRGPNQAAFPPPDVYIVEASAIGAQAAATPTSLNSALPPHSEDFVDSIFDMKGIAESPIAQPTLPIKFISPMKLQCSPRLSTREVDLMFAGQRNELAEKLSAVFAANRLHAEEFEEELSGEERQVNTTRSEEDEGEIPGASASEEEELEEGEIEQQENSEISSRSASEEDQGEEDDEDIAHGSPKEGTPRPPPEVTPPHVDKNNTPSSPAHHHRSSSRIPTLSPQRGTQAVAKALFPTQPPPIPSPPQQRTKPVQTSVSRRPLTAPASPIVVEPSCPLHEHRAESPPSPSPIRHRSTRQVTALSILEEEHATAKRKGKESQPRPPTPPPTAPVRAKAKVPKAKRTDKKVKRVLHGTLSGVIFKKPNFVATPPMPMDEEGLPIHIFSKDPNSLSRVHVFRTHENVAKLEYEVLTLVQRLVEANYVLGKPCHHLPSARRIEYEPGSSLFFIVNFTDFCKLSPQTIQEVHRDRNIVIRNVPQRTFDWSLDTLSQVGSLNQPREIQVGECRGNTKVQGMLKIGTLQDMFTNASERVLNCLSLPMSTSEIVSTPGLRELASDRWAWLQTRTTSGLRQLEHPSDVMNWSTVGTTSAASHGHLDDEGFGTVAQPLTGMKYWVIFGRDPSLGEDDPRSDFGSISFVPPFDTFLEHRLAGWMTAEAVELVPGDVLLQRPNTLHYVLTLEHSVTIGHHFYATSTIESSVHEIIHSLVRRGTITNDHHIHTRVLLRRMLTGWIEWHIRGHWDAKRVRPPHIMDVSTTEGLLDLISVGCLLELSPALDERLYTNIPISEDEQDEIDATTTRFRLFLRWYGERFLVLFNSNKWVHASYLFKRRLVDFACTIFRYIHEQMQDSHKSGVARHSLTDVSFAKRVVSHFSLNWPDIVDRFQESKNEASPWLYYTGPEFELVNKTKDRYVQFRALYLEEKHDYAGWPLAVSFQRLQDPPASSSSLSPLSSLTLSPPPVDPPTTPPPRKRNRGSAASTPNKTPSASRPPKRAR